VRRYFFDLRDGETLIQDEEGLELATLNAAQYRAARALSDMARDGVKVLAEDGCTCDLSIEVRDESGPVLLARLSVEIKRLQ
jgi:uncharacterized metal-binding protein